MSSILGLLAVVIALGPIAIVVAVVALWHGTTRRGRAHTWDSDWGASMEVYAASWR